jgi:periplasmic divalent cation tolerance protein
VSETITFTTCKDRREAETIARALVQEKLAACVNILPGVASIYTWKGKVEEGVEVLLLIKSRSSLWKKVTARVKQLHSYSVPEVVTIPIAAGNPDYLRWIRESTR